MYHNMLMSDTTDLFHEFFGHKKTPIGIEISARSGGHTFGFDLYEDQAKYVVVGDLPGIDEASVEITYHDNKLTIKAHRDSPDLSKLGKLISAERSHGSVCRAFSLPEAAEDTKIDAVFKNGVLQIEITKAPRSIPRKIQISKILTE